LDNCTMPNIIGMYNSWLDLVRACVDETFNLIATAKLQATMCDNVPESKQSLLLTVNFVALGLELLFVTMRIITRLQVQGKLFPEDWVLLAAIVSLPTFHREEAEATNMIIFYSPHVLQQLWWLPSVCTSFSPIYMFYAWNRYTD